MKKSLFFVLVILMVCTGSLPVLAASSLTDLAGTSYENAVENLVSEGVLSGYPDNTFKPENQITRQEVATILVKAMAVREELLENAAVNQFSDVASNIWSSSFINFCAEEGILSGYEDGTFKPTSTVTYYEVAAMLVNAAGYEATDLTGEWPDNYYNKAVELGIFQNIVVPESGFDGNETASRGNVAIMTNAVADKILNVSRISGYSTVVDQQDPTVNYTNYLRSSGDLEDFSGRAYGIILGEREVVNATGGTQQQLDFLYNGNLETVIVAVGSNLFDGNYRTDGSLDCILFSDGTARKIMDPSLTTFNFVEFTVSGYQSVLDVQLRLLTISLHGSETQIALSEDAVIYLETTDETGNITYVPGSLNDITPGVQVRLYSDSGSSQIYGPANIAVVKK